MTQKVLALISIVVLLKNSQTNMANTKKGMAQKMLID